MEYKILFCFYIMLRAAVHSKYTRIIGGSDADIREFSYIVTLRDIRENLLICGGVIISQKHILTSAHCSTLCQGSSELIKIYTVITPPQSSHGPSFGIDKIFIHIAFTGRMTQTSMSVNDISVIKVVETIEFNEFQNKIDLPTENIRYGVDCMMVGWGSVSYQQDIVPLHLQKTVMTTMGYLTCFERVQLILYPGHLCVYKGVGIGSGIGDSGSPLVFNNKLVGIVGISTLGAQDFPEIVVNVYYYLNFIRYYMRY